MAILGIVGPHTVSRLERAATRRRAEADWLAEGKHYLSALYFYGYVAEITLGLAFYRMVGYSTHQEISQEVLRRTLVKAKSKSMMADKSHPIDGWARLLIEDKKGLYETPYDDETKRKVEVYSSFIGANWGPILRYRAIEIRESQYSEIRRYARWFHDHSLNL